MTKAPSTATRPTRKASGASTSYHYSSKPASSSRRKPTTTRSAPEPEDNQEEEVAAGAKEQLHAAAQIERKVERKDVSGFPCPSSLRVLTDLRLQATDSTAAVAIDAAAGSRPAILAGALASIV